MSFEPSVVGKRAVEQERENRAPHALAVSLHSRFLGALCTPTALVLLPHLLPVPIAQASAAGIVLEESLWEGSTAPQTRIWICFTFFSSQNSLFFLGGNYTFLLTLR